MRKQLNCSPGNYQCGGTCISSSRNCNSDSNPDARKAASELSEVIKSVASGKGTDAQNEKVSQDKNLKKAVKKEQKKMDAAAKKVKEAKTDQANQDAVKEVDQAEKSLKITLSDVKNPNSEQIKETASAIKSYDNMISAVNKNQSALAIRKKSGELARQDSEESKRLRQIKGEDSVDIQEVDPIEKFKELSNKLNIKSSTSSTPVKDFKKATESIDKSKTAGISRIPKVNEDGSIDVESVSLGTDKTNVQKAAGAAGRAAAKIENAAMPPRRENQSKVNAIAGSVGRNAARAQAGAKIAGVAGRRAVADAKMVIDAIDRFRRNRRK